MPPPAFLPTDAEFVRMSAQYECARAEAVALVAEFRELCRRASARRAQIAGSAPVEQDGRGHRPEPG